MVAGWEVSMEESMKGMVPKMAKSIAGKKLPPVPSLRPDKKGKPLTSIMLFYQYVEPAWTPKQHRRALTFVLGSDIWMDSFQFGTPSVSWRTLRCMSLARNMESLVEGAAQQRD